MLKQIKHRSEHGRAVITSGRKNELTCFSFENLVFVPGGLHRRPVDFFTEHINSETVLGRSSDKPLKLNTPILFGAMSFGALSKEAKITLAKASTLAGTVANTGEGGMLPEEREHANNLTAQYSTGRFGVDEDYLRSADAIEVKIGQGAKPGQGGLLAKEKLTDEIINVRKVHPEKDVHSPAYHHDINSLQDLQDKISWLKQLSGNKPIILKMAAGHIEKDMEIAIESGADIIAIDGMHGGTGAAPEVMMKELGVPIMPAIVRARQILDKHGSKQELIACGGLNTGSDFAKALALGADAVYVGFPLLVAMGCVYCRQCHKGKCPGGITTHDKELRSRLDIEASAKKVSNYISSCDEEMRMIAGAVGKNNVHRLTQDDLRSMDYNISVMLGINTV